jgi:murein DD-endopeptidase MepM/ murein hydrolase activator NlpD
VNQEKENSNSENSASRPASRGKEVLLSVFSWVITGMVVIGLIAFGILNPLGVSAAPANSPERTSPAAPTRVAASPEGGNSSGRATTTEIKTIVRAANYHTNIEKSGRDTVISYTVAEGDSIFSMAKQFNITPESLLWANEATLNDNPDALSPGITLNIPPVDGVYYQWKKGDTLESVAKQLNAKVDDILNYPGNKIDLSNPVIPEESYIMVPGGSREFRSWGEVVSGGTVTESASAFGAYGCSSTNSASGSGSFMWPSADHSVSGNDFWSGHPGIDISAYVGQGVFAADSGVVVYAGWSTTGYGNLVVIDHNNGYSTRYGHLSDIYVSCGQAVGKGTAIGAAGSTGNSTGPHLHFEVRYGGSAVNPWSVLP